MVTVKELNAKCKKLGLRGYTRLSKIELEKLIAKHSKSRQKIPTKMSLTRKTKILKTKPIPFGRLDSRKYFEFYGITKAGNESAKFYRIERYGKDLKIRYGRIGTNGRVEWKKFSNEAEALKQMRRTITSKINKGYGETQLQLTPDELKRLTSAKLKSSTKWSSKNYSGKITRKTNIQNEIEKKKKKLTEIKISKPSKIHLEFHEGSSKKFYEMDRKGSSVIIRYGRIGTTGRLIKNDYSSAENAKKFMDKTIKSKLAKGYKEPREKLIIAEYDGVTKKRKNLTSPTKFRSKRSDLSPAAGLAEQFSRTPTKSISPMLVGQGEHLLENPNYIAQQKYDGTRCIIIKDGNSVKMISRSRKNDFAPNYPRLVKDIKSINKKQFILDSELTFFKGKKDVFVTALATEETKKQYNIILMVFDVLEINGVNLKHLPFKDRDYRLRQIIPNNLKHVKIVKSYKVNHKKLFDGIVSDDTQGEGIILKRLDSTYQEGGRNKDWVKVKAWKSDEAIIVGVTHGTGARSSTFGALILAQYDKNGNLRSVGKTSGFKESEQNKLIKMMQKHKTNNPQLDPLISKIPANKIKYWVRPKIVIEVKYQERMKSGKFRFPSFLRYRYDKLPKDCKL